MNESIWQSQTFKAFVLTNVATFHKMVREAVGPID